MPYEHQFRALADGLANTSADFAICASYLDLRIDALGLGSHFNRARHQPPPSNTLVPYRDIKDSLQHAAELLMEDANCMEGMINHIAVTLKLNPPLEPEAPRSAEATLQRTLNEEDLLHLTLGWQQMDLGILKTILRLYGLRPIDHPQRSHPGVASDKRLCEEIVSWLKVLSTDLTNFVSIHRFGKTTGKLLVPDPASVREALLNLENQYHRLVDDYFLLLTVLPYHLKHRGP
jgi:hypothetical protein